MIILKEIAIDISWHKKKRRPIELNLNSTYKTQISLFIRTFFPLIK